MNVLNRPKWFERQFPSGMQLEMLPNLIERLWSGPAAFRDKVSGLSTDLLTRKSADAWSIQENVGHVLDLEPLWSGSIDDFIDGEEALRPADLENTKTHTANHNGNSIEKLLSSFHDVRTKLVEKIEGLSDEVLKRQLLHPRLKTPLNVADIAYFVAEHDIHHLVSINELLRSNCQDL